jgi:hypothetical protein
MNQWTDTSVGYGGELDEWLPAELAPRPNGGTATVAATGNGNGHGGGHGKLDLNAVTFEHLRGFGLSTAEAARFVSYRQRRGGHLRSLDEVDVITGLSPELRAWLRAYGAVPR